MRLVPLIRGGGGLSSGRPAGVPSLVSSAPSNAVVFFEDFYLTSIGTGLTGGHPNWLLTLPAGTGTAGCVRGGGTTLGCGVLRLTTSTGSGDTNIVDGAALTAATSGTLCTSDGTPRWVAQWRFMTGTSVANLNFGMGLIPPGVSMGADWITDPDTTLLGASTSGTALVITRHAAAYSGDTAGAIVARLYDGNGTDDDSLELVATGSVTANTVYKIEAASDGAGTLTFYVDGAAVGTMSVANIPSWSGRPSMAVQTTTTAARYVQWDSYYQEVAQAAAR